MEPGIPTSFIPKRPIESTTDFSSRPKKSVGILSLLTVVIVLGTVAAFGVVYVYQKQLVIQKSSLDASINQARDNIGSAFVLDMSRLDARISGAKELINKHIVVTPIFEALEASTLRNVQYKDFSYTVKSDTKSKADVVTVTLTGTAKNYATIALQSDAFSSNTLIKNPVFSNLTVDDKTRQINFKLIFTVNVSDLSYQTFIDAKMKKQLPVTTP